MKRLAEIAGWYGMIAILTAYLLLSHDWIEEGILYQTLNVTGALGIVWVTWFKRDWQPLILNLFWAGIGISSLLKIFLF